MRGSVHHLSSQRPEAWCPKPIETSNKLVKLKRQPPESLPKQRTPAHQPFDQTPIANFQTPRPQSPKARAESPESIRRGILPSSYPMYINNSQELVLRLAQEAAHRRYKGSMLLPMILNRRGLSLEVQPKDFRLRRSGTLLVRAVWVLR